MGLDVGIYITSDKRKITRDMLPIAIKYPFDIDYNDKVEIVYMRKCYAIRDELICKINWTNHEGDYYYYLEKPEEVIHMIEIVASWMDEKHWDEDGDSIWSYQEIKYTLIDWIINLAIIYTFIESNPDCCLQLYNSY